MSMAYHPARRNTLPLMEIEAVRLWYDDSLALHDVSFERYTGEILAFIGPSGCGKSTALKLLNPMHDAQPGVRIEGAVRMNGQDIYAPDIDPPLHRKRFGWVAQKPNPFAMSIYNNVAYGARIYGLTRTRAELDAHVQHCLEKAHLWNEVKDCLHEQQGIDLSGGQQQCLRIARAIATEPEVLLMDEPTGSIDPIAIARVEALMTVLRADHVILVVTHSMMEAKRIADRVAFFHMGRLLGIGPTDQVFTAAKDERTRNFIEGKFG